MNERIKEFAVASQLVYEEDGKLISAWEHYVDLSEELEKFAELIIRACAEVAEDYDGAHYVGTAIKQHFGVEE